jgi:transposase
MNKTFINKSNTVKVEFDLEALTIGSADQLVKCASKSDLFRKMYDAGMEISEVARECGSHYSFVYGVISASREVRQVSTESKSDKIRDLADLGMTVGAIAKELQSNYSFVFSVVKKHKATKASQEVTVIGDPSKLTQQEQQKVADAIEQAKQEKQSDEIVVVTKEKKKRGQKAAV